MRPPIESLIETTRKPVKLSPPLWFLVIIPTMIVAAALIKNSWHYDFLLAQKLLDAQDEKKTTLEIMKLRGEVGSWAKIWFPLITSLVFPVSLAILAWHLKRVDDERASIAKKQADEASKRARDEADAVSRRFSALVDARAQAYAKAFAILKPTAVYFPETRGTNDEWVMTRQVCACMGRNLSDWYFGAGGVLMSEKTRNAYFDLMELLGRAVSRQKELTGRTFGGHRFAMPREAVGRYREKLGLPPKMADLSDDEWTDKVKEIEFGTSECNGYADFIYIQTLASRLRTRLTNDLESRLPPGGQAA